MREQVSAPNRKNRRVAKNKGLTFFAQSKQSGFVLADERDVHSDVEFGIRSDADSFSLDLFLSANAIETSAQVVTTTSRAERTVQLGEERSNGTLGKSGVD